jgi:uncharacterized protein YgbK (DUF1537 family)
MTPLIIADDFSGACDAAARAAHGWSAAALLASPIEAVRADLLAISTESRHATPEAARTCMRSLAPFLRGRPLYKKIDSTLRGPWIDAVDELLSLTDYSQDLVCPAFPAQGRTVRNGWLCVDDRPVLQVRCPFTVRDAFTEDDLARVAAELCTSILPVGSAGLAYHVFQRDSRHPPSSPAPLSAGAGSWIVLIGSDQPASQTQLQYVAAFAPQSILLNPASYPDSPAGVFATGGETASCFLRDSGAHGITGLRELLPGIPAGLILGGRYNGTVMITKAGGFGAPDAILRAIQFLQ